jgi:ATP-dependent Clp protease ATP-binding subunit ClpC
MKSEAGRFTPRAQMALSLARKEADQLFHNFIGVEHILLGLIKLELGVSSNVLTRLGLTLEKTRAEVEKLVGTGPEKEIRGNILYTPRTKRILDVG